MGRFVLLALVGAGLAGLAAAPSAAETAIYPVPRITVYPGDVILPAMLTDRSVTIPAGGGEVFQNSREAIIGKVARRTLLAGEPIGRNALREMEVIRSGKPVNLVFEHGGLRISSRGIAMQGGAVGDVVSAQNQDSGVVVRGVVQADGSLRLEN